MRASLKCLVYPGGTRRFCEGFRGTSSLPTEMLAQILKIVQFEDDSNRTPGPVGESKCIPIFPNRKRPPMFICNKSNL